MAEGRQGIDKFFKKVKVCERVVKGLIFWGLPENK